MGAEQLLQLQLYPLPTNFKPSYGTAGFRSRAELLASTVFRCGALMALRAGALNQVTGIVITASHNPEQDNGVKLVDPSGGMLDSKWESMADMLAQATSAEQAQAEIDSIKLAWNAHAGGTVMLAHDTRSSAPELCRAAAAGISAVGGTCERPMLLTTPQLHWMVACRNQGLACSEETYFDSIIGAFERLRASFCPATNQQELVVDAANGVGGPKLASVQSRLSQLGLHVRLINSGSSSGLNKDCGADFVQKEQSCPKGFHSIPAGSRCASLDGDADRLLYFVPRADLSILLLDGDRIAILAATLLDHILQTRPAGAPLIKMGIVQTAYANGASTQYVQDELTSCKVVMTPTGVKYLHHAAAQFDIGIYFEANGHGTVLFGPPIIAQLQQAQPGSWQEELQLLSRLMNQAVGDALSGFLLVEYALCRLGWGLPEWAGLYADLPSRQVKVPVRNRAAFTTTDAETRLVTPAGLQESIDQEISKCPKGRCFVRPSGTEDVVRVYAESTDPSLANQLAKAVANFVSSCQN